MNKALADAISLIEEAGGIVMMQDPDEDFSLYEHEDMIAIETEEAVKVKAWQKERQENWEAMKKKFDHMIGQEGTTYSDVENMALNHGFEMDSIEEIIHANY